MKSILLLTTAVIFAIAPIASSHCQVPCGIYSDDTVIKDLHTDLQTIEKAMGEINRLAEDPKQNANQITRWIMAKEDHANKIQNTMCQYFLAQRIKLDEEASNKEAYLKKISLCHKIIVLAMKCKQGTDKENAQKLHNSIDAFVKLYHAK